MRVLIVNQAFHPDVVATAQYAADLAVALVGAGHEVTVISSSRGYAHPEVRFATRESWRGVEILRVGGSGFGKGAYWRRALDFGTFTLGCMYALLKAGRQDVVVALTSPPLIGSVVALLKPVLKSRLVSWIMDLNPDEAVAAGVLRESSLAARVLQTVQKFGLRRSETIVVLDRFMKARIAAKGVDSSRIIVIPPWSQDDSVRYDANGRNEFRQQHGWSDKFVVMYSGNHSPCHPLKTLGDAASSLRHRTDIVFAFVGGGTECGELNRHAEKHSLRNMCFLPYQPREMLAASLSSADLHVVAMGDPFVGIVHPSKLYNALAVGAPILYIGPQVSHATEVGSVVQHFYSFRHGDAVGVAAAIAKVASAKPLCRNLPLAQYSRERLLSGFVTLVEGSEQKGACARAIGA